MVNHELSRVPQGSVLIPQIFLLFIKDMPVITTNTTTLFADGSKFQGTHETIRLVTLLMPMQGAGGQRTLGKYAPTRVVEKLVGFFWKIFCYK